MDDDTIDLSVAIKKLIATKSERFEIVEDEPTTSRSCRGFKVTWRQGDRYRNASTAYGLIFDQKDYYWFGGDMAHELHLAIMTAMDDGWRALHPVDGDVKPVPSPWTYPSERTIQVGGTSLPGGKIS